MIIKWIRPSGNAIETSDRQESIDYAELNGWKRDIPKVVKKVVKKKAAK